MANHEAPGQMIGYIYQIRYALNLLLKHEDETAQIGIEKFDDISFNKEGIITEAIQLKHHKKGNGKLIDSSNDLWRTIKVWIDAIEEVPDLTEKTEFVIITTAIAPDKSAAYYLKKNNTRCVEKAYNLLKEVSNLHKVEANEKVYIKFNKLAKNDIINLLNRVYIVDDANDISDVKEEIKEKLKYSCLPKYEELILNDLEGWWFDKVIKAMQSIKPIYFTQNQIRSVIVSISRKYREDNLPIESIIINDKELNKLESTEKGNVFHEQLKLICLNNHRFEIALKDYYKAYIQRAAWVRKDLLFVNELDEYEAKLIDEWEHEFYKIQDEIDDCDEAMNEKVKVKNGKNLFNRIEEKNINIRTNCNEAFIMRGSYHMLSSILKIGWHMDFYERLKDLIGKEEC